MNRTDNAITRVISDPVQGLLFTHTGFAALMAAQFWYDSHRGLARSVGAVSFLVAAAASLILALLLNRRHDLRRMIIGFEGLLVPLQFALSVLSDAALLGLVLSIAILALLRPTFPKMSQRLRKFFLALHVGVSVSWLGVSMAMAVLSLTGLVTEDLELRHYSYALMHIFDMTIVIPLVLLSVVTGLVVSFGTHWGLVQHWWILSKFVLAVGIVTVASVWENYWVRGLADSTGADRGADLKGIDMRLAACMVGFSLALWVATILSVYKPWGRTPWARRRSRVTQEREVGPAILRNTSRDGSPGSTKPVVQE